MKFSDIIDSSFVGKLVNEKLNVLEHIDPDRIYVERIRSFYGVPYVFAKLFCEMAVKQGFFTKHIGVTCPNEGRILKSFSPDEQLPEEIECFNCQMKEEEQYSFRTKDCDKVEFYKLVRR